MVRADGQRQKKGQPYRVVKIDQSDVFDCKPFVRLTNWDRKVEWSTIKEVRVEGHRPSNVLQYKVNFRDKEHQEVVLYSAKPTVGRRPKKCFECPASLPLALSGPIPISAEKKRDLLSLCDSNIVPKVYHDFYQSLQVPDTPGTDADDDLWLDDFFVNQSIL
jgi:hypothetical protein